MKAGSTPTNSNSLISKNPKKPRAYLSLKVFGCFFEVTQFGVKVFVTLLDEKQNVVLYFTSKDLLGTLK